MLQKLIKDSFCIVRARLPLSRRLRLLGALISTAAGSRRMLGWKVEYLGRGNLRLLYSEIFARQIYHFSSSKRNPIVLDCGANIGMATFFFKSLYPEAQITAFEPDPVTFKVLQHNISSNRLEDVAVHNVALASEESHIPFYVPESGSLMMSAVSGRSTGKAIDVPAQRLSSFIVGEVDLLKLDIEGMEGPVLQELVATGKLSLVREAIIEVHHNLPKGPTNLASLLQLLEQAGFHFHVIDFYSPSADCAAYQDVLIHATKV
jgi:FkbM family methyltransferase